MFIETSETPNPNTMKFNPGVKVLDKGIMTFTDQEEAVNSPLASKLLNIDGVTAIFFSEEFITVTKEPKADWSYLRALVLADILDHFTAGLPVVNKVVAESQDSSSDTDAVTQIKEILETRVRPAVAQDGGDIVFKDFKDGVVYVELHGACSGCPSSTITLKNGVENMLRHYVPEVESVEAV